MSIEGRLRIDELRQIAAAIPSMGGREIGAFLSHRVRRVRDGEAVVELGTWLGAGTAQLCLGLYETGVRAEVHCYDRFEVLESERRKARTQGVVLGKRADTLPWVQAALEPFGADVCLHKGALREATYQGPPIAMYVDDACKREREFLAALAVFVPWWIPGRTTVVLMDYWYFRRCLSPGLEFQHEYVSTRRQHFEEIWTAPEGLSAAAFLYRGGLRV